MTNFTLTYAYLFPLEYETRKVFLPRKSPKIRQPVKEDVFIKTSVGVLVELQQHTLSHLEANGVLPLQQHYLDVHS